MKKRISVIIYIIGCCLVTFFLAKALIGGSTVNNPEAMLPFTDFERNCIFLGIGFIPMALSCLFLIRSFELKELKKRILVFLPGMITAVPFVYIIITIIMMLVLGVRDAIVS